MVNKTHHFFKKKSNSEFLTFDAAPQGGLASNTKSTREQFCEISVSKCWNKIDASESIIHIDASWRDGDSNGDMVFRLEKKSQWVCDVLPFCAHFLPHTRRNWAILLQRFGANFGHSQVNGSTDTLSRMDERSSLKTWGLLDVDNRCGHVALVHQVLLVFHDVRVESLQLEQ